MKPRFLVMAGLVAAILTGFAGSAKAAPGVTTDLVKLRAGPGHDYPVIARIAPHSGVEVMGCIRGWEWCDVAVGNLRGWASYKHIRILYHHHNAVIGEVGPIIGLPFVAFDLDTYWDRYYWDRPFYHDYYLHHPHPHGWHDHDWHESHDHDHDHDHDWHDHDHDEWHHDDDGHWHHH